MSKVKVICPKCGNRMTYKNWFSWVWHTPFHWFGRRRTKCTNCGEVSYMGGLSFYFKLAEIEERGKQLMREHDAEVAREIFADIEREIKNHGITYAQRKIAELKKKYTEGKT